MIINPYAYAVSGGGGGGVIATKFSIYPRDGVGSRMNGAKIYGSTTAPPGTGDTIASPAGQGWVELGTLSSLSEGTYNDLTLTHGVEYEYLIVHNAGNYCECKEFKFFAGATDLAHVTLYGAAAYSSEGEFGKAFAHDDSLSTSFTTAAATNGWWAMKITI